MLDPWIIEEIQRREEERQRERQPKHLELPLESPHQRESEVPPAPEEESERGVVIIDL